MGTTLLARPSSVETVSECVKKVIKCIDVTEETLTSLNRASIPVIRIWESDGLTRASCMICLDSEARHLKQRPFSGLVNKNTSAGYSPIISVHCVYVAISKTSITFKSVFFIRYRRSDSSIFVDKWNLTAATIARSFSQRPQAAIRQPRARLRIHVQPRFQRGFRNGVTFLRVVYGMSFGGSATDWYSSAAPAMLCAILCYTIQRYNGTRLYFASWHASLHDNSRCCLLLMNVLLSRYTQSEFLIKIPWYIHTYIYYLMRSY